MPPDGGTTIHESQLLRIFGAPAAAAADVRMSQGTLFVLFVTDFT